MNWERFWWNNAHGPRSFVNALTERAISGKSFWIMPCSWLPWRDYMRELSQELVEQSGAAALNFINESGELLKDESVGEYLIRRFTAANGYRPHSEKWWEYIKRTQTLNSKRFWVYSVSGSRLPLWNEACRRLKGVCSFVIELGDGVVPTGSYEAIDANSYVSEYDYLLLASMAASERDDMPDRWRRFISELAVQAFSGDAEHIIRFIESYSLSLAPEENDGQITREAIWTAQLRNIYHIIEEERIAFIKKYSGRISECLPETQYQEDIVNPYDAELGLLWHLTSFKREETGKKRLILPKEDYERLYFLRETRNRLAHHDILTPHEIERLMDRR